MEGGVPPLAALPVCCRGGGTPDRVPRSAPQAKPLEELSELYASAAEAQEAAAASPDPALARERLQAALRDIAGASSFPATAGEPPAPIPPLPGPSAGSGRAAAAAERGFTEPQPSAATAIKSTATNAFI